MGRYDDMLRLPHPEPRTRPRMPLADRAAQFSSFAALSGYEDAVAETARLTDVSASCASGFQHHRRAPRA